jgi:hypothetical protein
MFANRLNPGCHCCHVGSPPGTVCFEAVTCSGEPAPASSITLVDDLGNSIDPSSSGDSWACFETVAPRHYTACLTPPDGWGASGCVSFFGPRFGRIIFHVYRTPLKIRIDPSSTSCDGGKFPADTLTFSATCPFPVKPNGVDRPGYYGTGEFATSYPPRDFGPYGGVCDQVIDGTGRTVYDQFDGQGFYYWIPASARGVPAFPGPFLLFQVPTTGATPGVVFSGSDVSRNPCAAAYRHTRPHICGGVASPECGGFPPALCNCFSNLCFPPVLPGDPCPEIGLDDFWIDWSIPDDE